MRRLLCVAGLFAGLVASRTSADYLKASRATVVHETHSSASSEVGRLTPGGLADLASGAQTSGYYHVTLDDGTDGWVYRTFVRRFPGIRPGHEGGPGGGSTGASTTPAATDGALDASAYAPSTCPPEGKTQVASLRLLNQLKNRSVGPLPSSVKSVLLEDLVSADASGSDRNRWQPDQAIEVVGFVRNVKKGGVETCNCGATAKDDRDTHIELVSEPDDTESTEPFIVEVTPTWRRFMRATKGVDWTTSTLGNSIKGKWIKVRGWMMFDSQHTQNATNTSTSGTSIWRATCWEIHPITGLEIIPAPVQ